MTDAYTWTTDNRPRRSVRVDVRSADDRTVEYTLEEPTEAQATDALAVFERLAATLISRVGGAA